MKKQKNALFLFIALLVIALALSIASCSRNAPDATETTEASTEATSAPEEITKETAPPTEAPTEVTEPETTAPTKPATEPPATNPVETKPAHQHSYTKTVTPPTCTAKGYTTYKCTCGAGYTDNEVAATGHNYKSEVVAPTTSAQGYTQHTCKACGHSYKDTYTDKLPAETQPQGTEPPATEPPATEAPAAPEDTQPAPCQHSWQKIDHPEVGHYEGRCVCRCGARFSSQDGWATHRNSYSAVDALTYHGGWASGEDYVIDVPAYSEWICSKCGTATTTQP